MTVAASVATTRYGEVQHLFGIPVAVMTMADAVAAVDTAVARRERLMIGVVNAAKVVNMRRDAQLRDAVLSSDLILADGFAVVAAARVLGRPIPERVPGIDLMCAILERGRSRRYRVFCLGATADVLRLAERAIAARYPGVELVGRQHGYFAAEDEPRIAAAVRASQADVLFVAMTSPRKEQFLAAWGPVLDVPVCHGVGGSFDVLAGKVRRAPESWQRLGFEWLYRVLQEPRRLWKRYLVTNSLFLGLLVAELCRGASDRVFASHAVRRAP
jgi:N-acetylglucosaminyldiphosphoundecaprenol N-acetyl-beta-D-mannosaminyltransferase